MRPSLAMLLLMVTTSANLLLASRSSASISLGPISNAGRTYYLVSQNSWVDAEAEAISLGGHLATVDDATENTFLVNNFVLAAGHSGDPLWIGLNDAAVEGTFAWASGAPVAFTNWQIGEPNNLGGEDYAAINWHFASGESTDHGTWNDTPVNGSIGFGGTTNGPYFGIVEVVPEPGGLALGLLAAAGFGVLTANRLRRRQTEKQSHDAHVSAGNSE